MSCGGSTWHLPLYWPLLGEDPAGANIRLGYGLQGFAIERRLALGEQAVGLAEAGAVEGVADRSRVGEARLRPAAHDVFPDRELGLRVEAVFPRLGPPVPQPYPPPPPA